MATDVQLEVYRAQRTAQDRYDYFILAAAGAAIGFALSQTHDRALAWTQLPLGAAILCWGASFYSGCHHLMLVNSILWSNAELLEVQNGQHPMAGRHPQAIEIAAGVIRENLEKKGGRAVLLARWQSRTLMLGGVFYIIWHVLEMYLRLRAR